MHEPQGWGSLRSLGLWVQVIEPTSMVRAGSLSPGVGRSNESRSCMVGAEPMNLRGKGSGLTLGLLA